MKTILIAFVLLTVAKFTFGQGTEFDQPWQSKNFAIVLDAYGPNTIEWNKVKTDENLPAILHKASEGLWTDKKYILRRDIAKKNGYKWGSFHFGKPGDPVAQALYYLKVTGNNPDEVYAIDVDGIDPAKFMTIANAREFILTIKKVTGRYPLFYCPGAVATEVSRKYGNDTVFSRCKLWLASPVKTMHTFKNRTWKTYTLWQFSSEMNCKKTGQCWYNVPGVEYDIDINVYNGTKAQLIKLWPDL